MVSKCILRMFLGKPKLLFFNYTGIKLLVNANKKNKQNTPHQSKPWLNVFKRELSQHWYIAICWAVLGMIHNNYRLAKVDFISTAARSSYILKYQARQGLFRENLLKMTISRKIFNHIKKTKIFSEFPMDEPLNLRYWERILRRGMFNISFFICMPFHLLYKMKRIFQTIEIKF